MTLFAVAGNCGGFAASRVGRLVGAAVLFQQAQQGEQAHAAAGAGEEVAAGVGALVMRRSGWNHGFSTSATEITENTEVFS